MKEYKSPKIEIIKLEAKESIADIASSDAATGYYDSGVSTTVYNFSLLKLSSGE